MNNMDFELLEEGVYRLKVPFEDLYTSVFALVNGEDSLIFDTATTRSDVENYIIPAVEHLGISPSLIVCSHRHSDHCGGFPHMLRAYGKAVGALYDKTAQYEEGEIRYLNEGDLLLQRFEVLNLKGHSKDSIALYDTKNRVLISCDCLQLHGISKFGTGVTDYRDYKQTLERVKGLMPNRIISAHEFVPLGFSAKGEKEVTRYLSECDQAIENIRSFAENNRHLSDEDITLGYNRSNPQLPPINLGTIRTIRKQCL